MAAGHFRGGRFHRLIRKMTSDCSKVFFFLNLFLYSGIVEVKDVRLYGLIADPALLHLKAMSDTQKLNVSCVVTSLENVTSAVMSLTLSRAFFGRKEEELAKVSRVSREDKLILVTAGRSDGVGHYVKFSETEGRLECTLLKAGCKDAAEYSCEGQFLHQLASGGQSVRTKDRFSEGVLVDLNPWKSSISGKSTDGGMQLKCTSFTLNTRGDVQWVWEERRDGSNDWEEETEVITTQDPPPGQLCITPHSSTFTRKLTRGDDNAVFRCYTVNNYTNTSYVEFAAIIKMRDFLDPRYLGLSPGAVVGGVIIGIIIFVLVVVGRRAIVACRQQKAPKAAETQSTPQASFLPSGPIPVSPPPAANAGQPFTAVGSSGYLPASPVDPVLYTAPTANSGHPATPTANSGQRSTPTANSGQPSTLVANSGQPSTPTANSGQPSTPTANSGQPSTPTANSGQPSTLVANSGQPSTLVANSGQSSTPTANSGQPSTPTANSGQPSTSTANSGQPSTLVANSGQPSTPTANSGQSSTPTANSGQPSTPTVNSG